jgi:hypothetical protein
MIITAQEDHPYILEWLVKARERGGGFVSSFANAALVADRENYPMIRPAVQWLIQKYPEYKPSEAVKKELETAALEWERRVELNAAASAKSLFL